MQPGMQGVGPSIFRDGVRDHEEQDSFENKETVTVKKLGVASLADIEENEKTPLEERLAVNNTYERCFVKCFVFPGVS